MPDISFEEGKLWGEGRDPTLKKEGLRGLNDERLGRLLRALSTTAGVYREALRSANCPPLYPGTDRTEEEFEARAHKSEKFHRLMDAKDGFIGTTIAKAIEFSNIDANAMAMYSKTAVFKEDEPVLYWEHWGTDDLDDPSRDSVEFQMFVGLNDHLQTEAGKKLAHNVLVDVLDGSTISPSGVPSGARTFGTLVPEVFEPFIKQVDPSPAP